MKVAFFSGSILPRIFRVFILKLSVVILFGLQKLVGKNVSQTFAENPVILFFHSSGFL